MNFSWQKNCLTLATSIALCSCTQKMGIEGHLRTMGDTPAFSMITREPPEGTVAQNEAESTQLAPLHLRTTAITKAMLQKGREQFNIYCMPCHGMSGYGDGVIVQRGFLAPPSYHIDRLRKAPDQHFFDVITQGYGAMYAYADRVIPSDRWAIIAYIRALQLSQNYKD